MIFQTSLHLFNIILIMIRTILKQINYKNYRSVGTQIAKKSKVGLGLLSTLVMNFSEENKPQPKNKHQAWLMQEQQNLKKNPFEGDQLEGKTYKGISKTGMVGMFILACGLGYMAYVADKKGKANLDMVQEDISGFKQLKSRQTEVGGEWTLLNSEGQPFSSRNLRGYYYLIYFGFSKCPDICPSTLYYLSSVYRIIRNLPQGAYIKLKIVFVSIDPQRDTPKVLKQYLLNFGKHIVGVTSSPEDVQLKQCMKKFRIKSQKVQFIDSAREGYNLDHTTRVFLMDPQNIYLYHLDPTLTEQQSAKAIIGKIVQNEHRKEKAEQNIKK